MDTNDWNEKAFEPTFTGTRQERKWIHKSLLGFYRERWLSDVLYRVKPGKEATVYCCRAGPETGLGLLAAKVFRPRMFRAMRNDALYKTGRHRMDEEGKMGYDRRSLKALEKKSKYGRWLDTASWVTHEFRALVELYEAGADVPQPLASSDNAILMEYVGDEDSAAPILQQVALDHGEARVLLERLVQNVEILLSCFRVHADLSAYNVLYWDGDVRIIDFPQTIDAMRHPQAFELFQRDVDRLCRYFVRQGVDCSPVDLAWELWERRFA